MQVFWQVVEQKPGPIVAAIVMLGIGELISGFAITAAKVIYYQSFYYMFPEYTHFLRGYYLNETDRMII